MTRERRLVLTLAVSQTLYQTGGVVVATVGGLAGLRLAPSDLLATLPIAMIAVGNAIMTIPASFLMGRIGRKPGFILGALFGATGGALAAAAMVAGSFPLLCAGMLLLGAYQGFAQFYRLAAGEAASPEFRSQAISYVLAGGVVAAVAGPYLGAQLREAVPSATYAGSFLVVAALGLVAVAVLALTNLPSASAGADSAERARPMRAIARQPRFLAAVAGAAVGYAVMVTVMTATPLSMVSHDHSVGETAFVIQWHVLGMFVPSFFTGWLIRKLGVTPLMLAGLALLLGHVAVAVSGSAFLNYLSALVLLGLGWNFLYIGGSTLLLETHFPAERAKVQAFNDFTIVATVAVGSFCAGVLNDAFGWQGLNLLMVPFLLAAAVPLVLVMMGRPLAATGLKAHD